MNKDEYADLVVKNMKAADSVLPYRIEKTAAFYQNIRRNAQCTHTNRLNRRARKWYGAIANEMLTEHPFAPEIHYRKESFINVDNSYWCYHHNRTDEFQNFKLLQKTKHTDDIEDATLRHWQKTFTNFLVTQTNLGDIRFRPQLAWCEHETGNEYFGLRFYIRFEVAEELREACESRICIVAFSKCPAEHTDALREHAKRENEYYHLPAPLFAI